jgi:hypothetical protein
LAEQRTANVAAWAGVIAATSLLYFEVRPVWVLLAWALLALVLIVLATVLHRTIFLLQSLALLFAAAVRALLFNLFIRERCRQASWSRVSSVWALPAC